MSVKVCAFTGHRPIKFAFGYNEAAQECIAVKKALEREIHLLICEGVTVFISGMAQGVDLWAAEILLKLRAANPALKLYCAVPYKGHANEWPEGLKKRYDAILEQADRVSAISTSYTPDCFAKRDKWMVDRAQYILAVLKDGEENSGTGQTVKYAEQDGKKIIRINPDAI